MARKKRMIQGKIPMKRCKRGEKPGEALAAERRIMATVRKHGLVAIDRSRLFSRSAFGSFSVPILFGRYYKDYEFICQDCGAKQIWTGRHQKWWYEEAKGEVESLAIRCRACRHKEHERRMEVRRLHQEGLERKRREREARG